MPNAMMGSIGHPAGQMATTARASRTAAAWAAHIRFWVPFLAVAPEHDVGATNVHRVHFASPAGVQGKHRGGVHDRVTPRERAFDRGGLGHLTDGGLDSLDAERTERGGDLLRRSRQDPDSVPGTRQRRDRV
jgi:hypothetical protein